MIYVCLLSQSVLVETINGTNVHWDVFRFQAICLSERFNFVSAVAEIRSNATKGVVDFPRNLILRIAKGLMTTKNMTLLDCNKVKAQGCVCANATLIFFMTLFSSNKSHIQFFFELPSQYKMSYSQDTYQQLSGVIFLKIRAIPDFPCHYFLDSCK